MVAVRGADDGYDVVTDQGVWRGRCVVLASGACNKPSPTELRRGRADRRRAGQPAAVPQSRTASRRRRARRRGGGDRRAARRRDPCVRPPGDPLGGRARPRCRGPTEVATSSTGWRSIGRLDERYDEVEEILRAARGGLAAADRHPRTSHARPQPAQRCGGRSCAAGSAASATASRCSRAACATTAPSPTRSSTDCSTTIDAWIEEHEPATSVGAVERFEPTRVARGMRR